MSDVSVRMTLKDEVSSKLDKIKSSATTTARQFSNAGKAMDEAFRSSAASDFASQAESAFSSATSEAEALGNAINEVNSAYDDLGSSAGAYQDVNGRWHDANGKFIKSLGTTGEKIKDIDETLSGLGDDTGGLEGLSSQVGDAGESMEQASAHAINFGSALKTVFAVAGGAVALSKVKEFAMDSISLGKEYTSMISEVAAISGASVSDMEMMETVAREYGASTIFSASEAAEALKYMSLAGWDAQQSTSALGGVLNLAAASGMGLGEASDIVTGNLSAFGMEANQSTYLADMLAHAQSNSLTTAAELGEAYKNAAANMHASGQDVETTTALLEAMANQNRRGSEAGTSLAAVMRDITSKMDEGAIKIGETSIAVEDANGNFRDMTDIMTEVESATEDMGSAQRVAALSSVFTDDSIKAVNMVLAEGMDKVRGYEEALRSAAGASEDMANTMNDNLKGDMANMSSAYEEMQLQVFEAMEEPLRDGAQWVTEDIIPTLTEWVPDAFGSLAGGISKVGEALSPMINTVLKNPQAVGAAFASIGTGFAAMKTVNTGIEISKNVSELGGMTKALSHFGTKLFGSPWAAGAAAAVSAITAVGFAMKEYSDMQIEDSLEAHFGSVSLDNSQVEDFASKIIDAEWLVNIDASLGHFENAEEFTEQAEEALKNNDSLEWKARVGIELTEDERSSYMQNIEGFKSNIEQALTEQTVAANMVVSEFNLKSADGVSLGSKIEEWAKADLGEIEYLSSGLTNLVQNALQNGIIDVDEQAAIDELQSKINNIMEGWQEAEAQAELDMLTQKYGRLSGADLDDESFSKVVEELGEQRETATAALEASEKKLYTTLNALNRKDEYGVQKISDEELFSYKSQAGQAIRNEEASMIGNSLQFEVNTLSDTYGEKLEANYADMQSSTARFFENANSLWAEQDYAGLTDSFRNGFTSAMTGTNWFSDKEQKTIAGIYEQMKPDVESMAGVIDEYRELGQAVPRDVWDEFNSAVQVGAAAGDVDAAWQVLANEWITTPANKALKQAVLDGKITAPEGFRKALERIPTELTDEPLTIEGMQADVENFKVNREHVEELLTQAFEGLEATGDVVTINGTAAVEYEVTAGQTMSEIASECGLALEELISANPQIENPNVINVGQKINIPASACSVDASGVSAATEEAVSSQTGEPIEREQPVKTVMTDAGTDDSQISQAAQEQEKTAEPEERQVPTTIKFEVASLDDSALSSAISEKLKQGEAVPVDVPANITVEAGTIDLSPAVAKVQSDVTNTFASAFPADGTVDVTLAKGSDNIGEVYDYVGGLVRSAFTNPYSAYGSVNVVLTANYSLANPSATINFGGGATGSATVTAALHAEGGIFDTPHYGVFAEAGPEAFIPIDGSDNAKAIWQETGIRLGLLQDEAPISIAPTHSIGTSRSNESVTGSGSDSKLSSKEINLNINGSGNMRIDGGVQKEDVLNMMVENIKDVLLEIIEQEILEEGDGAYEY